MIGGVQGDFGDLDNKYLKQNIPKYLKMSVGNIRKLQENTAALYTERKTLWVSVIRRSGYVYPEKLKRPPLPSGCDISGCKMSMHGIPDVKCPAPLGYPDQFHPDSPSGKTAQCYPDSPSGKAVQCYLDSLSGKVVQCYPDFLREKHTALVNITPER